MSQSTAAARTTRTRANETDVYGNRRSMRPIEPVSLILVHSVSIHKIRPWPGSDRNPILGLIAFADAELGLDVVERDIEADERFGAAFHLVLNLREGRRDDPKAVNDGRRTFHSHVIGDTLETPSSFTIGFRQLGVG